MKDYELTINMFGEFSIVNESYSLVTSKTKSPQLNMLLSYLIANKDTDVTKDKLIDVLWPEGDSNNPSGALRNLVYRARNELSKFFPNQGIEAILLVGNTYHWNSRVFDSCNSIKPLQTAEMRCFFVKFLSFLCCMCCIFVIQYNGKKVCA